MIFLNFKFYNASVTRDLIPSIVKITTHIN